MSFLWLSYEEAHSLYVIYSELHRDSSRFWSLRMSLRTAFSVAILVAVTGVVFSRARTTGETRIELCVHFMVVYANTVGLRFNNKYTCH